MDYLCCENVNKTTFGQSCLIKYIVQPFTAPVTCQWHQNLWQVPMLASLVGEFGYNVDVINWNVNEIQLNKQYDLLIDISPHNRQVYQQYLKSGCPQVLYATGSYLPWQRQQEEARLDNMYQRRGVSLPPQTSLDYAYPHPDTFDALFLIGNSHTLETFGPCTLNKISLIKNTGYALMPKIDFSLKSPRNFLFFASHPQVLKGLDLLLEAFSASQEANLFICSLFQKEPEFCKAYETELYHRPNIKAIGFVDFQGEAFQELVRRCSYIILPSCSEGISGSVLSGMSAGLIPIVSQACGLEKDEAHILEECSVECLRETIHYFASASAEWLRTQTFRSLAIIGQRYNPRHYILSVQKALTAVLGRPSGRYIYLNSHLAQERSACMIANTRVGIPLTGGKYWHGGVSHVETLVKSLSSLPPAERPQLYIVITARSLADFDSYRPFVNLFDRIIFLGTCASDLETVLGITPLHCQSWEELFSLVDFCFPLNSDALPYRQAISWIPDFQHRYLPEFFSSYECQTRDNQFRKIAEQAHLVILNSPEVEADFKKYYPDSKAATKALGVCTYPEEGWYRQEPGEIQQKYHLPDRFVLCSNQFWIHKDHLTLFQAVSILKKAGHAIHVVCTGPTEDYRAPGYFDTLQSEINSLSICENITILGLIPREDQIQLLRRCLFVVQPSLFEGLSLIVQECRALAKPIVLSDLDVHIRYQYGTIFNRRNPQDLAQKMTLLLASCQPGPDKAAESRAKTGALTLVEAWAREFCDIVLEHLGCPTTQISRQHPTPSVTILTSLTCANVPNQQAAIRSWQQCGFNIVALNTPEDIAILKPDFPDVEFATAYRDARSLYGKPFIFLQDLLDLCAQQQTAICGIVKSDIVFKDAGLAAYLSQEAANSIVFGSRLDLDSLDCGAGIPHTGGFDYIFFDKSLTNCYPPESFCLGLYWWDYWLILMALANDIPGKVLASPVAYHVKHPAPADVGLWHRFGILLSRYAETDYAVTAETMAEYQQLLFHTIQDNSVILHIDN